MTRCVIAFFFVLAWPLALQAQAPASSQSLGMGGGAASILPLGWELSYRAGQVAYSEPGVMREQGFMQGVGLGYSFSAGATPLVLAAEADYLFGTLAYDGAVVNLQTGESTPFKTETQDTLLNLRALAAYRAAIGARLVAAPFAGMGMRYLNDDIQSEFGYEREITYYYLPLGLEGALALQPRWALGARLEYDVFLSGRVVSHLGALGPRFRTLEHDQATGDGYRFSLSSLHQFSGSRLKLEPYMQFWDIADSNVVAGFYEPRNNSTLWGLNVGIIL